MGQLEYVETTVRECVREFPFRESTVFRQVVVQFTNKECLPALDVIRGAIHGQRGFVVSEKKSLCNQFELYDCNNFPLFIIALYKFSRMTSLTAVPVAKRSRIKSAPNASKCNIVIASANVCIGSCTRRLAHAPSRHHQQRHHQSLPNRSKKLTRPKSANSSKIL